MKNALLLTAALAAAGAAELAAQRTQNIAPGTIGGIESFIEADLASTDTATVEGTTYILARDGIYPYTGQWQPIYSVNLRAADGEGARPRIVAVGSAEEGPRFFRSTDSYSFVGLRLESEDTNGAQTDNAPLRPRGNDTRLRFEDCVLNDQRFEVMRTQGANQVVYFIDNIIARNYQRVDWYKSGGLWFQNAQPQDSMIFRGNTYYDSPGRVTHNINGSVVNYLEFSNNTIHNVGGLTEIGALSGGLPYAVLDLGISLECIVENNVIHDVGFMGVDEEDADLMGVFNWYPFDEQTLRDTFGVEDPTQSLTIRNNNVYTNPDLYGNIPDSVSQIPLLTAQLDSFYVAQNGGTGDGEALFMADNISEALDFANVPDNQQLLIDATVARWANPATANNDILTLNKLEESVLDFSYPEDAESFTAATDGGPLGARRWFPNVIIDVRDLDFDSGVLAGVSLSPNPVVAEATLRFRQSAAADIAVELFDLQGRSILSRDLGRYDVGAQSTALNLAGLPAGNYVAVLRAETADGLHGAVQQVVKQ